MNSKHHRPIKIILTTVFLLSTGYSQPPLVPIVESGLWGLIDQHGKVYVTPRFSIIGHFAEGLAPARLAGTYGFINASGDFVIPPQFDFAEPFEEGLALAWRNGAPFFIDRNGDKAIDIICTELSEFVNGRSVLKTGTGKVGLIDRKGHFVLDTLYDYVHPPYEGMVRLGKRATTTEQEHGLYWHDGLADTNGIMMIPLGYAGSHEYAGGGYFWHQSGDSSQLERLSNGRLISLRAFFKLSLIEPFSEGLAIVLCTRNEDMKKNVTSDDWHKAYIDTLGNEVAHEPRYRSVKSFRNGRADVFDGIKWLTIDRTGKELNSNSFYNKNWSRFKDGFAVFSDSTDRNGVVDTSGKYVVPPLFGHVVQVSSTPVLFACRSGKTWWLRGVNKSLGDNIQFSTFAERGFSNGLLLVQLDSTCGYINTRGEVVWREKPWARDSLDIDYMLEANCKAHSRQWEWGRDNTKKNYPRPIPTYLHPDPNALSLHVVADSPEVSIGSQAGATLYLVNRTEDELWLPTQDNVLYIKLQALAANGMWRDIYYLSPSFCGNSYSSIELPSNKCLTFPVPRFRGSIMTKLRFKLIPRESKDRSSWKLVDEANADRMIYSNEFGGRVNPAQFWRKVYDQGREFMSPFVW